MKHVGIYSGIQRKYLKYTIALLLLALFLSSIGVGIYFHNNLTQAIQEKSRFAEKRMGMMLDNLFQKSEEVTEECIVNANVQKSLQTQELSETEKTAVSKYFAYTDLQYVVDYCYVDNKKNVYTRSYTNVDYADFEKSGFQKLLGDEYAKTQWFWAKDTLFGTEQEALFIGRYVHSMEYSHEPGMLFFKMAPQFLEQVVETTGEMEEETVAGITDAQGDMCAVLPRRSDKNAVEKAGEAVRSMKSVKKSGIILDGSKVQGGMLTAYRQEESRFTVYTFVPNTVVSAQMRHVFYGMCLIYLFVIAVAVNLSIYFSRRFTKPIQDITEKMADFDGNDFTRVRELHTGTELDQIGHSYNELLGRIEQLLQEIKDQQSELRTTELNMLISQINPHFLYNTLDTIYMLARINHEETTMKMIQALSKYLRLSLSKGREIVTVEDELENVKSYMEIQQIRNENLFTYEIDCQVEAKETYVLKLLLQPLVENAVKYGFCDIYEGGIIRIAVKRETDMLVLSVSNNGTPMDAQMAERINSLKGQSIMEMKEMFPDKKHGYGVANILTRLRLKYGEEVEFGYEVEEDKTTCIIRIPGGGREDGRR